MSKYIYTIIICFTVLAGLVLLTNGAKAAVLSVSPASKTLNYGESLLVDIRLSSEQKVVNAVQATITFPTTVLSVVDVSRGGSFLSMWPQEPVVDAKAGTISFAAGIPNGSLVTDGKVLTIIFRAKVSGTITVGFNQATTGVYLNDGLGTKADTSFFVGTYQVTPLVFIPITSPTHPKEDAWYADHNPVLEWEAKQGADYSYVLSADPAELPDTHGEVVVGRVTYSDLADGVYYFILRQKLPGKDWVVVGSRRVMIDTVSPLPFKPLISQDSALFDGRYFVTFSTTDIISGLDYYDVVEGGQTFTHQRSPYLLKDQSRRQLIIVRAVDKAGNRRDIALNGTLPQAPRRLSSTIWYGGIALAILLLLSIFFLIKKQTKGKQNRI